MKQLLTRDAMSDGTREDIDEGDKRSRKFLGRKGRIGSGKADAPDR